MTISAVLKRYEISAAVRGCCSIVRDRAEEAAAWPHEVMEEALAQVARGATKRVEEIRKW